MHSQGSVYRKHKGIDGDFDVIIIGSGIGGMGAGSVLAQQGLKVLLLEQHNVIGGLTQSYDRDGYRWSVGMHYIGDVGTNATLTWKLFDYATQGGLKWHHLPPIYNRMMLGDREYRIPAGREAYRDALISWFPDEIEAIDRYLNLVLTAGKSSAPFFALKAFPQGFDEPNLAEASVTFNEFANKTTEEVIKSLTDNEELLGVLCANWGDYGSEPSSSSFAMHAMLKKHYINGASYPEGGGRAFADVMVPIIEKNGGAVYHSAEVAQILIEDGKAKGVELTSGEKLYARSIVSNAGIQNTFGRLIAKETRAKLGLDEKREALTYTRTFVGLHIGLEGSASDLGLEPANIWAHPSTDFDGNLAAHKADFEAPFPFYFVTFASAKDPTWAENFPNKSTIEMYALTDYGHFEEFAGSKWMKRGDAYEAKKANVQERMLRDLYKMVPGAEGAVRHVEVSTPLTYETFVKQEYGSFLGVESTPTRFKQAWMRATTPVKGLYLSGQDVTTDGVIGALFGGILGAAALLGKDLITEIKNTPNFAED